MNNIERIFVLMDGSSFCISVLNFTSKLAELWNAKLEPVFSKQMTFMPDRVYAREVRYFSMSVEDYTHGYLWENETIIMEQRISKALESKNKGLIKLKGAIEDEILNIANANDMIVLGKRSWGKRGFLKIGRAAQNIVKRALCPILMLEDVDYYRGSYFVVVRGNDKDNDVLRFVKDMDKVYPKNIYFFSLKNHINISLSAIKRYYPVKGIEEHTIFINDLNELVHMLYRVSTKDYLITSVSSEDDEIFRIIFNFPGNMLVIK